MRLTVLLVAYPFAKVGPDAVGGAEQILSSLDRSLSAAGHRSIVVAQEGSKVLGTLFPTPAPGGEITGEQRERTNQLHQDSIDRAIDRFAPDLVHFHGIDFLSYGVAREIPALATLHLPLAWYPPELWTSRRCVLQCVSNHQRRTAPREADSLIVVENGVPIPALHADRSAAGEYALTLGRICPEKNFHEALDAGTIAGVPVWIGGQVFPYAEHKAYFENSIMPRLCRQHRFLGPLAQDRKQQILAGARCLLLPSRAPETSSLVAMEALAAGVPVIAYRSGAIPEIVDDGETGFLVDSPEQMAAAMLRVGTIHREQCYAVAVERFSATRMVADYFRLYERILMRDGLSREGAEPCLERSRLTSRSSHT